MTVMDTLNGTFTTLVCEPAQEVTDKIVLIGNEGSVVLDNSKCDDKEPCFFISYSRPCFSNERTMFVNIIHGDISHIGKINSLGFIK